MSSKQQRTLNYSFAPRALVVTLVALACMSSPAVAQGTSASEVEQLRQRVQQLEGQLVDMQVVIGTLESLARTPSRGGGGGGGSYGGGASDGRIAALETQIRALAAEVQQLRGGGSGGGYQQPRGSSFGQDRGRNQQAPTFGQPRTFATEGTTRQGLPPVTSRLEQGSGGFGSTTVKPSGDPIGSILSNNNAGGGQSGSETLAGNYTGAGGGSPESDYEAAYGALLQQNYAKAENAFAGFVDAYPRHKLAGNAQYWLGEVHYVRGDYKSAASAFLKGYQSYAASPKAPDSLLKLAMSLERLGQRQAACSSFSELSTRFPQAPRHVRSRAQSERRR
ncbi:MAG: tol-pal system protein YbgF, partial [Pseudomonadota bacterium]